ncbi:MAG: flavodoxin family protein [Candidatus Zixiibacteriota bacterium]
MKILVINGSPKGKGNTDKIVKQVQESMQALGDYEFVYLYLKDMQINPCKGCMKCITDGEEQCPASGDDIPSIEKKMHKADAIVFAAPVYTMSVPFCFKLFMDRMAYVFHRPRFFDKVACYVTTTGGVGEKQAIKTMKIFEASGIFHSVELGIKTPPFPISKKAKLENDKTITNQARKFHKKIASKDSLRPNLGNLLQFKFFKLFSGKLPDYFKADNQYWKEKGWLEPDCKFFTDKLPHIHLRFLASIIYTLAKSGFLSTISPDAFNRSKTGL